MHQLSQEDYVFRYRLEPQKGGAYQDRLVEMMRAQLENILNIVIPVCGEREVKVDGFKLLRDREGIYKIFPDSAIDHD